MNFEVQEIKNPYQINLSGFTNLVEADVTQLTYALEVAGIDADCDGMMLYPKKRPTVKTKQLILFFVMGALQEAIESYDNFKVLYNVNAKSKQAKAEDETEPQAEVCAAPAEDDAEILEGDADLFGDDDEVPAATPAQAKAAAKKTAAKRTAAAKS